MRTSEKIDLISTAIVKAQKEVKTAIKDSDNPFFTSKYADLTTVFFACKEALTNAQISVIQGCQCVSDVVLSCSETFVNSKTKTPETINSQNFGWCLQMRLLHISGQWIEADYPLTSKDMNDPQKVGSSMTYARRYLLAAMVGIVTEDDDGNRGANKSINAIHPEQPTAEDGNLEPLGYKIPFGKFKQRSLEEVGPNDLGHYIDYLESKAKKDNKIIIGVVADFIHRATEYIVDFESQPHDIRQTQQEQ